MRQVEKEAPRPARWRAWTATTSGERTDFGRWHAEILRGSKASAKVRASVLGRVCENLSLTPDAMVEEARLDPKRFATRIADLVDDDLARGIAQSTARFLVGAVQSWLQFNGLALARKPKLKAASIAATLGDEGALGLPNVRRVFANATPRGRTVASFMHFAGVRPETLGMYESEDGLKLADLPDLQIVDGEPSFRVLPARVLVRASISKTRRPYLTFLHAEGAENTLSYLQKRRAEGETLGGDSPVIKNTVTDGHVATKNLTLDVKEALRASGIDARPYVLRVGFSTAMLAAESRQGLPHAYAQHMMGHIGDMDARYSINKGRLPPDLVEDMRKRYDQAAGHFLATTSASLDDSPTKRLVELETKVANQARELEAGRAALQAQAVDADELLDMLAQRALKRKQEGLKLDALLDVLADNANKRSTATPR